MGRDVQNPDGVRTYAADAADFESYRGAGDDLARMQAPVLLAEDNLRDRLFVATFDGTGNNMNKDAPEHHTGVARIYKQIYDDGRTDIVAGYVEGPGTQDGFIRRTHDRITGASFDVQLEKMYKLFIAQSGEWLKQDPEAQIRLASIGFSRGGELAAAFTRMVHERGIQNPEGAKYTYDRQGNIVDVEYTKPPLVAPGQVAQAVGLFDPVATGRPAERDRRLAESVISGFQITAEDERRDQFRVTDHLTPGFTDHRRFLNVVVGGAHSNIGDCYALNGLGIRSTNLMVDYLNALSDRPFLHKRAEPDDPALNVVHRSEEHLFLYTTRRFRDGVRDWRDDVADPRLCQVGAVGDCWNKAPVDEALARQFEFRPPTIAPVPVQRQDAPARLATTVDAGARTTPADETAALFERLGIAALTRDDAALREVAGAYRESAAGAAWLRSAAEQAPPFPVSGAPELQSGPETETPAQRPMALRH